MNPHNDMPIRKLSQNLFSLFFRFHFFRSVKTALLPVAMVFVSEPDLVARYFT